ncbi:MAG: HAD family hydrolase [Candidatus Omnitrophica bacterium]|nr:HAD family hydrolase [Candidatus Omnitrophota bacterium]
MQKIKLIIFDLDGTLVDAYRAIEISFNYCLRKLKLKPVRPAIIRRAVGWGDKFLLAPFVNKQDLDTILSVYRKHHKQSLLRYSKLYPKARLLLRQFKAQGYKLAVASNRPTEFSLILLKHLRIREFFDFVLCADSLKHGKPAPEILNKIVRRFALPKSQVLYVGDMVLDAQAGRRAGIKTIIVTTGSSGLAEIKKEQPAKIIPEISKLAGLI